MVPAGDPIDAALDELDGIVDAADVVVDGGNSNFHDTLRRAERTDAAYVDFWNLQGPRERGRGLFPDGRWARVGLRGDGPGVRRRRDQAGGPRSNGSVGVGPLRQDGPTTASSTR